MQFCFIDTYEALQTEEGRTKLMHVWKMPSGGKRGGKLLRNEQGGTVKVDKVCHVLDTLSLVDDELCKSVTMLLCAHEKLSAGISGPWTQGPERLGPHASGEILSFSMKVDRSRHLWVSGRKSAGGTKPNGPKGGLWV